MKTKFVVRGAIWENEQRTVVMKIKCALRGAVCSVVRGGEQEGL